MDEYPEEAKIECTNESEVTEVIPLQKSDEKSKKSKKKKNTNNNWKDKYERFYKNKKKFNLDIIRSEEGPFLFKIQLQYLRKGHKKLNKQKTSSDDLDADNNSMPGDKLKRKVLNFFKSSQHNAETDQPVKKSKDHIILNYDKIKL